jgi:hypothetical protein
MLPLVAALLPLAVVGAEAAAPAAATVQPIDQARIAAMKPWQLRREMERAEGQFYDLYNKLSTKDEFDIVCTMQAQPNSKFKARSCRPRFLVQSSNTDAAAFLDGVLFSGANTGSASETQSVSAGSLQGSGAAGSGQRGGSAMVPGSEAAARQDEYRKYMLDIINSSPDLLVLVRNREALGAAQSKLPPGS